MPGNSITNTATDLTAQARQNVTMGPLPSWVVLCPYSADFKAKANSPVTHLLINWQTHAEHRQTFVQTALRLETIEAVQRLSQWRIEFEPRTQSVMLHWIKVRRGDVEFANSNLENFRLLQRESGLEGLVIDGWFTLLLLLEDVRPGDILDCCYTIENRPRLLPDSCTVFFTLPAGTQVGKYQFTLHFAESRPVKWKASSPELTPKESRDQGKICWEWMREMYAGEELEEYMPDWYMSYPWIQVSDCPDWAAVASAFAGAWPEVADDDSVLKMAEQIRNDAPDILSQTVRAIQLIQDEFRYLSVNIELGGQVPAPCALVTRRRFGDCKDLSFLLVQVLKKLGLSARPILVNTILRQSVGSLLPMPLFNHVIVEYQIQGETRWVDATQKRQGGGALQRTVRDYGFGLPVDTAACALIKPPRASTQQSQYELSETVLIDTTGAASCVAIVVVARGSEADVLRHEFEIIGAQEIAKKRLQACANRFGQAERSGSLEYRDNRTDNEFFLAEVFEINGFLRPSPIRSLCEFFLPNDIGFNILKIPDKKPRKAPYALPWPCHVTHNIEIISPALPTMSVDHEKVENAYVQFSRHRRSWPGCILLTFNLTTLADAVPADQVADYRKALEKIRNASGRVLRVPVGHARPRRRSDFGMLPDLSTKPSAASTSSTSRPAGPMINNFPSTIADPVARVGLPDSPEKLPISANVGRANEPGKRTPRKSRQKNKISRGAKREIKTIIWTILLYVLALALFVLFLFCMYLLSK